jgi:hypothetical protein
MNRKRNVHIYKYMIVYVYVMHPCLIHGSHASESYMSRMFFALFIDMSLLFVYPFSYLFLYYLVFTVSLLFFVWLYNIYSF